jgi:RHS repeat-associated protein
MRLFFFFFYLLIISISLIGQVEAAPFFIYDVNLVTGQLQESSPLYVETYQPGHNALGREDIILSKKDFRIGRVKLVEIKTETTPHSIYFYYTPESTKVIDRPNFATVYCYDAEGLIQAIEHYLKEENEEKFYRRSRFFWDPAHPSYLRSRTLEDTDSKILFCDYFLYNEKGQLIKKSVAGQLSGTCCAPLIIQETGYPLENGIETYHTYYTYSDDEHNLLLSELEDNGRLTLYQYDPKTHHCIAKLKGTTQEIFSRCFYRYDTQGFLFQTIIDDGNTSYWQDLTGATQRQIIECQISSEPLTKCQLLGNQTFYWDFKNKKNILIARSTSLYGSKGELVRENFYDANATLIYYIHHHYDEAGNPTSVVDSRGEVGLAEENPLKERFDAWGQRIATTDQYGNTTHYGYDAFKRLIAVQSPRVLDENDKPYHPITAYSYNVLDQIVTLCDSNEKLTRMTYNPRNQPLYINYPDGTEEIFVYFLDGEIQQQQHRDGTSLTFTRDEAARLIQSDRRTASGQIFQQIFYTYRGERIETVSDHQSFTLTYLYDEAGREIGTIHETKDGKAQVKWDFDAQGQKTNIREWFGLKEEDFVVKKENQVSTLPKESFVHFDSSSVKNTLGQNVKQEEWVYSDGIKEVRVYDALQRLDSCTKWNAFGTKIGECHYRYDANGNLIRETHTVLNQGVINHLFTIQRLYDACNRLISISEQTDQSIKTTRYVYINNKISEVIKPNGTSLYYLYNEKGELSRWYAGDQSLDYHYEYDLQGRLITCYDACHQLTQSYGYNAFNDLIEDKQSAFFSIRYHYDQARRRTHAIFPNQTAIAYQYTGPLLSCIQRLNADQTIRYMHQNDYNENNRLQKSYLINDLGTIHYAFDEAGYLTFIQSPWGSQDIQMETKSDTVRPIHIQTKDAQGLVESHYNYGENKELIDEPGHHYTYDSLHNRLSDNNDYYECNQLNQLIKNSKYQLVYDLNGCLIEQIFENGEIFRFSYDAADRLIRAEHLNHYTIDYWYDAQNRRLGRRVKNWNKNTNWWILEKTDHFIYDHLNEIGQLDENGVLTALRILGRSKGREAGSAIALEIDQKVYAPIHDLQGSISCLIDCENKSIAESYRYSAFGTETIYNSQQECLTNSEIKNPWRYSSKRKDEYTHLICFGLRDYSPALGRWMTPDPLQHTDTPNVYAYVKNDPINFYDQYGLFSVKAAWNNALDCLFKGFQYLQISSNQSLATIANELNLSPSVCKSFERVGKYFLSEGMYLLLGFDSNNTHVSHYGKHEIDDKVRVTFINGMLTTQIILLENLEMISESHGGVKVHYVFRPTEGWTGDILRALHIRMLYHVGGFRTKHACLLAQLWKTLINEMEGVEGKGVIIHYAHSLGGSETDRARGLLSPEEQKMIRVITFGSATLVRNLGFQSVKNFVSIRDPVSTALEIIGTVRNFFDPKRNVYYHGNVFTYPYFLPDHFLTGSTYGNLIRQCGEEFLAEFNLD